jgi:hypothetical protein
MKKSNDVCADTVNHCVEVMESEINRVIRSGRHADLVLLRERLREKMTNLLLVVN